MEVLERILGGLVDDSLRAHLENSLREAYYAGKAAEREAHEDGLREVLDQLGAGSEFPRVWDSLVRGKTALALSAVISIAERNWAWREDVVSVEKMFDCAGCAQVVVGKPTEVRSTQGGTMRLCAACGTPPAEEEETSGEDRDSVD